MASYQLSTSTPYQGGPIVDLGGLAVTQGGVVAVLQALRASLQCHQWAQPVADHPALTFAGVLELGSGAKSSVLATAGQDVAITYQGVGANAGSLMGWLGINTTSFVHAATPAPPGGRPSMSGFASTVDAPPGPGGSPRGDGRDVNIGPVGKRVVTAYNQTANPDSMRLTIWNVPYQTFTSLGAPLAYQWLATSPARRPSVVGLREAVDGVSLRAADLLVACANASDHLLLRRYAFDTATPDAITMVASAATGDSVGEIATLAVPSRTAFVVVTAVATLAKQLKLIAWKLDVDGPPVLWFEQMAGMAERVQMVRIRNRDFAIGTIDSAGTASVRYWRLPEASAAAPMCQPLATSGSVAGAKAIRLAHRPGSGAHPGTTFVAVQRQDDTFVLRALTLTEI
jgi:hypothetical protein